MRDEAGDDELIVRAAGGDRAAFSALFDRHGRAVLKVGRAFAADDVAAEDVAQETFLAAWRAIGTYRPGVSSARTWLFAIARNAARHARRRDREVPCEDLDAVPLFELGLAADWVGDAPDDTLGHEQDAERLARAVASLPRDDREVVLLRDVQHLSGEDTAAALGLGLPAMKSGLHRARLRLMAALRAGEGGVVANERDVGGLTCSAVLERLGDYVDGDLARSDVARIDAHLRGCTVCERFGGRYARVVHAARERLGAPHDVDEATFERVRAALRDG